MAAAGGVMSTTLDRKISDNQDETVYSQEDSFDDLGNENGLVLGAGFISYRSDFGFKVAVVAGSIEQSIAHDIKIMIDQLLDSDKTRGRKFISVLMKFNKAVLMTAILKNKMRIVLDTASASGIDVHKLEVECLKIFQEKVSQVKQPALLGEEYFNVCRMLDDWKIAKLYKLLGSFFARSIEASCACLMENMDYIVRNWHWTDEEYGAKTELAVSILLTIGTFRTTLAKVMSAKGFKVLSDNQRKITKTTKLQNINSVFLEYLNEIYATKQRDVVQLPISRSVLSGLASSKPVGLSDRQVEVADSLIQEVQQARNPAELEVLLEEPIDRNVQDMVVVYSARFPETTFRIQCCPTHKPEEFAALYDRFPEVEGLNDAVAIRLSVQRILRLYPDVEPKVISKLFILEFIAGLIGSGFAAQAIVHPERNSLAFRIWKATAEGVVFFVFLLGVSIDAYRRAHPDTRTVSDNEFWSQMASGPLTFLVFHTGWNLVPPLKKEVWFPRGTCLHKFRILVDFVDKWWYYSGIFKEALTLFKVPGNLMTQLFCLIPSLAVTLGQIIKEARYKDRLKTMMTYITTATLHTALVKSFLPGSREHEFESQLVTYVRIGFWSLLMIGSSVLVFRNGLRFVEVYEDEETQAAEIIAQRVRVPVRDGVPDISAYSAQGTVVDLTDFSRLEETFAEDRALGARADRKLGLEGKVQGDNITLDLQRTKKKELLWMSIQQASQEKQRNTLLKTRLLPADAEQSDTQSACASQSALRNDSQKGPALAGDDADDAPRRKCPCPDILGFLRLR